MAKTKKEENLKKTKGIDTTVEDNTADFTDPTIPDGEGNNQGETIPGGEGNYEGGTEIVPGEDTGTTPEGETGAETGGESGTETTPGEEGNPGEETGTTPEGETGGESEGETGGETGENVTPGEETEGDKTDEENNNTNKNKNMTDYRNYDFGDEVSMEATMPKVMEKLGNSVGGSEYKRVFPENNNIPLCDTTYGTDCLETINFTDLD